MGANRPEQVSQRSIAIAAGIRAVTAVGLTVIKADPIKVFVGASVAGLVGERSSHHMQGQNAQELIDKGIKKGMSGDFAGAIDEFKKAIAVDPKNSIAYFYLGNVYNSLNEYDLYKQFRIDPCRMTARLLCYGPS